MDDRLRQVRDTLRATWHRRWIGLAVAWVVGIAAVIVVLRIPDKYEASARIYVDTQSVLKPLMSGLAVQPNVDWQIAVLSRTLISRPNVEKLIRMADLDLDVKSKRDHEEKVDELLKTLEIKGTGRDNLYTLAYRDPEPERAKRVVQALSSIFVESSLGDKRKDTDQARKFIEEQIKVYEKKLQEAENRLKEFKLRHLVAGGIGADGGKDYFTRLNEVNTALSQARLDLREAEDSRDALRRQVAGEVPVLVPEVSEPAAGTSTPELDARIDAQRRHLDALLQRFTDQHPDVVGTRRVIAQLEEDKSQLVAARTKMGGSRVPESANSNPVYQQLKVSLGEAEATVASLRTRVAEFEARYARLRESARMVPQIEAEYTQLNRDYDIQKKSYESLVSRRESASISGEMEATSGVADFRLIDPPRVSPQPVAPNRMLLVSLALVVALGAGVFASFAASHAWPTIFDSRALRAVTGLPVLGTVSLIGNDALERKERRGLIGFIAGLVALIGSFGSGVLVLFLLSTRAV